MNTSTVMDRNKPLSNGCKIWSVNLMDEHRLRVFENIALKRTFGPKNRK
jgi:hypothetical protein